MGKRCSVWKAPLGWCGLASAWLVLVVACGSRNELPGALVIDDDTNGSESGGSNNTVLGPTGVTNAVAGSAISTNGGVTGVTGGVVTGGVVTTGVTTGMIPSTGAVSVTGVGGAPPCPSSGTTGGTGGTGGAGGYGGEGGAPSEPEVCEIPFCNGWTHKDGNCAGIQGEFFAYSDQTNGGTSTISMDLGTSQVCVRGQVNRVIDGQYDVYWGAGFGMNLNQAAFNYLPEPYDAEQHGVVGFGFSVSALPAGGELRFMVRGDDYYCTSVVTTGYAQYSLADLVKGCWDPLSTPHDYSRLTSIEWHFVSNASTAYNFALCMTDLSVYRDPSE